MTGAKMVGSVDHYLRPILRLKFAGQEDELIALIDTGFNGQLPMSQALALRLNVRVNDIDDVVTLADGSLVSARQGSVAVEWFGRFRTVHVQITPPPARMKVGEGDLVLLGTRLIAPDNLEIQCGSQTLTLRQEA
jgi:predicted aspartyl protease